MLVNVVSRFKDHPILLLGDLMLDSYTIGEVKRVSPEAPVCVLKVERLEDRPGGVGNVSLGIKALGASPLLVSRLGKDAAGERLKQSLVNRDVSLGMLIEEEQETIVKNRMVGSGQQMLRVDFEKVNPLDPETEKNAKKAILESIENCAVVGISDYAKGFLSDELLAFTIIEAKKQGKKVVIDPKGNDFTKYHGATLIKPNLTEAYQAASLPESASLDTVAQTLLKQTEADALLITRSSKGMSLFTKDGVREDFPAMVHEVVDVTGAGDTVLSTLLVSMANGLSLAESVHLSNVAASLAVQHFGCSIISHAELAESLLKTSPQYKVFTKGTLPVLKQILHNRDYQELSVSLKDEPLASLFQTIQSKYNPRRPLVLCITDLEPKEEELELLSSLTEVGYLIVGQEAIDLFQSK